VATVDGHGITVAEVESFARTSGEAPRAAYDRLLTLELLAAEAERRGYEGRPAVRHTRAQAMVQELLRARIEEVVTPASISAEAVAERYEAQRDHFAPPERRASRHLLVRLPEDASPADEARARALAGDVLRDARRPEASPAEVFARYGAREIASPLEIRVETLPPLPRQGALEDPFAAALFATDAGALHPAIVRTRYGFHVIEVTEVSSQPAVSLAEAEPEIREALALEGRAQLLSDLLTELSGRSALEVDEAAFGRAAALRFDSQVGS
jgi:peptidyl-prolyl cis-trans isomerase D